MQTHSCKQLQNDCKQQHFPDFVFAKYDRKMYTFSVPCSNSDAALGEQKEQKKLQEIHGFTFLAKAFARSVGRTDR